MSPPWHLFQVTGVELEYMIVDQDRLDVRPLCDRLLGQVGGTGEVEVELGPVAWSNELALHVVEIKTNGPVRELDALASLFQKHIGRIHASLAPFGARLMPTAMHPWMDPHEELRLWPHEAGAIYRTFDRIFDCRGHGWANLQSLHINLPFCGDDEFRRLHRAVRYLLPILPALTASSPLTEGRPTGLLDTRMEYYRNNARRVPSVAGRVVPEDVAAEGEYREKILERIFRDMHELDPEGILRHEWVNSRGCIARFDRMALEIRTLDVQECPAADVAVTALILDLLEAMVEERMGPERARAGWDESVLGELLLSVVARGGMAPLDLPGYAPGFGVQERPGDTVGGLWLRILERLRADAGREPLWAPFVDLWAAEGCLSERILRRLGSEPRLEEIRTVYRELCDCLIDGTYFHAEG